MGFLASLVVVGLSAGLFRVALEYLARSRGWSVWRQEMAAGMVAAAFVTVLGYLVLWTPRYHDNSAAWVITGVVVAAFDVWYGYCRPRRIAQQQEARTQR